MESSPELDEAAWKSRLDAGANQIGFDLDQSQLDTFWRFAHMLRERNQHVNLTSIVTLEGILTLHMLDSLAAVPHLGEARRIVDVGTGGGFPGIPLAVACPDREFTLIDGTQKKIRFVAESIAALDIRNARAVAARAENFAAGAGFDLVIVRAVGSLAEVVHNAGRLVAPHGRLLVMKGRMPDDELRELPAVWKAETTKLRVPGLDAERHLVALSRQRAARNSAAGGRQSRAERGKK